MSRPSLPRAADSDERAAGYLADLRLLGYDNFAEHQAYWFECEVLYFDTSGRIVEAGTTTEKEEVP